MALTGVIAVIIIAVSALVVGGNDIVDLTYVQMSVNPRIEFVCKNEKVVAVNAINEEAKELCAQQEFIGQNVVQACTTFLDLCARSGYVDVAKTNNAVKISCVAGLSQALEVKVYSGLEKYLKDHQILGAVLESVNDNETVTHAKNEKISVDKYVLVNSLLKLDSSISFQQAKAMSVSSLITALRERIAEQGNPAQTYTEEQLINKKMLLDLNRDKFAAHVNAITDKSRAEFSKVYTRNQKTLKKEIQDSFDISYNIWKNNHINFVS